MAYDRLRDAWDGAFGETFNASWCFSPPVFGEWLPGQKAICAWELSGQSCDDSAIANIAIASKAIASKLCKDFAFNRWNVQQQPCTWTKLP